RQQESDWNLTF
nr:immunoglobulin light chain junction region [Macaca mulatta]